MSWDVWEKNKRRFLLIGTLMALCGCGQNPKEMQQAVAACHAAGLKVKMDTSFAGVFLMRWNDMVRCTGKSEIE